MKTGEDFTAQRAAMVREQIERRGIRDPQVLAAMRNVPRHNFLPTGQRARAYADGAQRIGQGQTISQPYIVALMTELLALKGHETVLEVGTGSGYQAAVLAQIAAQVHSIERHPALAQTAQEKFKKAAITNIKVHIGDGTLGLSASAPYQAIIVTAAAPRVPPALLEQLDEGGRLVIPVGGQYHQNLEVWQRKAANFTQKTITAVTFVPLLGDAGWQEKDWQT